MIFVFTQKKKQVLVIGNQVMLPFGKWPFKCLIGVPKAQMNESKGSRFVLEFGRGPRKRRVEVTGDQMHEIENKLDWKNRSLDEGIALNVLHKDGGKPQAKQ